MIQEKYYYETGLTDNGMLGPGVVRRNLFTTTNREKALNAFEQGNRNYLIRSRVIMELNGVIRRKHPGKNIRIQERYDANTGRWKKI